MNKRILSIFVAVMALMFALTRCDKNEAVDKTANDPMKIVGMYDGEPTLSDKEIEYENKIRDAVTFVGQGKSVNYIGLKTVEEKLKALGISGASVGYLYLSRKKCGETCANCTGLCWYKHIADIVYLVEIEDNILYLNPETANWNNFTLKLANKPDIEMQNAVFTIDEDIDIYGEKDEIIARIYAGEYSFSPKIGKFGGYKLKSAYVK